MYIIVIGFAVMVLCAQSRDVEYKEVLTITGNFSLNGKLTNLAQYDISSGMYVGAKFCNFYVNPLAKYRWSNSYEAELYVYGESYGVVWDTSVNRSTPSDELIVVGAFDTVSTTSSQIQYCSVGVWTGMSFNKVRKSFLFVSIIYNLSY